MGFFPLKFEFHAIPIVKWNKYNNSYSVYIKIFYIISNTHHTALKSSIHNTNILFICLLYASARKSGNQTLRNINTIQYWKIWKSNTQKLTLCTQYWKSDSSRSSFCNFLLIFMRTKNTLQIIEKKWRDATDTRKKRVNSILFTYIFCAII